jgi:hypothetical protein
MYKLILLLLLLLYRGIGILYDNYAIKIIQYY